MTVKVLGTEELDMDVLCDFPGNARRGALGTVRESIREHGQYRSLIVRRRDGKPDQILCGHTTRDSLVAERYTTARCEIVECTDGEARKINVVDNRSQEEATWDTDALIVQLEMFGDDFTGTGFTVEQAEKLMFGSAGRDDREVPEDEPAWQILLDCESEEHQAELLTRFADEGLACRPLIRS